ncbi:MAG TPA: hypothetical protein VF812_17935 [Ktedonobacterales bacterium]
MSTFTTTTRKTDARSVTITPHVIFYALALVMALACLASATGALDRDEGAFLVIAQEVLHGRIPYRDVFDQKPPGIYYLYAGLLWLTGSLSIMWQILALRLCVVVVNVLTGVGLLRLGTHWRSAQAGRLAMLLWLSVCAVPLFGANELFTEPFAACATVWAMVVLAHGSSMRAALGAGLLMALGSMFKQTAILALPTAALVIYFQTSSWGDARLRRAAFLVGALALGAATPWLAISALFALAGALRQFVYQTAIVSVFEYPTAQRGLQVTLVIVGAALLVYAGPLLLLASSLVTRLGLRAKRAIRFDPIVVALALLILLHLLTVVAHPYPHYMVQALPWLALLLAIAVAGDAASHPAARRQMRALDRFGRPGRLAVLGLPLFTGLALAVQAESSNTRALSEQVAVGSWIASQTPPHARLLIAPAEPEFYYLSGRAPSTPYVYLLPVDYASFPLASVTDDIRARRFDVVVWLPNTVESDAPAQLAAMRRALDSAYQIAPGSNSSIIIYKR